MYSITIITLGGANIGFQFKERPTGLRIMAALAKQFAEGAPEMVTMTDDYSRDSAWRLDEIAGYLGGDPEDMVRGQRDTQLAVSKVAGIAGMGPQGGSPLIMQ